jgi:hypothetical protein
VSGQILEQLLVDVPVKNLHLVRHKLTPDQVGPIRKNMLAQRDLNALFLSQNDLNTEALGLLADGIAA